MAFGRASADAIAERSTRDADRWKQRRSRLYRATQASLADVRLPKPAPLLEPIPRQVFPCVYVPPKGSIAFSLLGQVVR